MIHWIYYPTCTVDTTVSYNPDVYYDPVPIPVCLVCGKQDQAATRIGYGSERDGEYICGPCLDKALDALEAAWVEGAD